MKFSVKRDYFIEQCRGGGSPLVKDRRESKAPDDLPM